MWGTKIWSGNAAWAGFINVFVKLDGVAGDGDTTTGFVLRQGVPGLRQGPEALTMGVRGMVQNSVHLEGVAVDAQHMLGGVGQGMAVAHDAMMHARLGLGAISLGAMTRCAQLALRYASRRTVGTGRLLDNPVTLVKLTHLMASVTAMEGLVSCIGTMLDQQQAVPAEAFVVCKTAGPELLWRAVDDVMQLLGGRGYIEPNGVARLMRDARLLRIFEGPTETLHMFLGLHVLSGNGDLDRFLRGKLRSHKVADRLRAAAEDVKARCLASGHFSTQSASLRLAYSLIGEVATNAVLLASARLGSPAVEPEAGHRAAAWAEERFERGIADALDRAPLKLCIATPSDLTTGIADYVASIGDLRQAAAGCDDGMDDLLGGDPHA